MLIRVHVQSALVVSLTQKSVRSGFIFNFTSRFHIRVFVQDDDTGRCVRCVGIGFSSRRQTSHSKPGHLDVCFGPGWYVVRHDGVNLFQVFCTYTNGYIASVLRRVYLLRWLDARRRAASMILGNLLCMYIYIYIYPRVVWIRSCCFVRAYTRTNENGKDYIDSIDIPRVLMIFKYL